MAAATAQQTHAYLSEEQRDLQHAIRQYLATHVEPLIDEHEKDGTFPFEVLEGLADFGYLGGRLPEELGGQGIDFKTWAMMFEELGYCWGSLRTMVNITNGPLGKIAQLGSAEIRDEYLPPLLAGRGRAFTGITEPDVGSDVSAIKTRADLVGDEWVLSGEKMWITGGAFAHFGVVIARTYSPDCDGALSAFLVDLRKHEGIDVQKVDTLVLRSTGTSAISFTNTRIPRANLLGKEGSALSATLTSLSEARLNVAMGAVGAAQKAYDLSVDYARSRQQFGRPIGSFQLIQKHLVDMRVDVDAARALGYAAADALDAGIDSRMQTSIAKLFATESSHRVANLAMQVHGGMGYATGFPIERIFRDTRGGTIPEGTSEIQTLIIGRQITGIDGFGR